MGYLARSIARIPSAGFDWFVVVLEDDWDDQLRRDIDSNFKNLASRAGPKSLAVRALEDPRGFSEQVHEAYGLEAAAPIPALLISDLAPADALQHPDMRSNANTIIFPLGRKGSGTKNLPGLLEKITSALRDDDAIAALKKADKSALRKYWGWLRFLELKPNFMGFGMNLNRVLDKYVFGDDG